MAGDLESLSSNVLNVVKENSTQLYLSAASGWEVAILEQLKRVFSHLSAKFYL